MDSIEPSLAICIDANFAAPAHSASPTRGCTPTPASTSTSKRPSGSAYSARTCILPAAPTSAPAHYKGSAISASVSSPAIDGPACYACPYNVCTCRPSRGSAQFYIGGTNTPPTTTRATTPHRTTTGTSTSPCTIFPATRPTSVFRGLSSLGEASPRSLSTDTDGITR